LVEFVLCCLRAEDDLLNKTIFESGVIAKITTLFFAYPWNTSLHVLYEQLVTRMLGNGEEYLINYLITT
jgi:hypothetical protein